MGEMQHQRSTRHRSSTAPIPTKTRKFSLSNFLGAASSKTTPKETTTNDDAITNGNGFVGMVSMGGSFARRHSTSEARPTPYHSHRNNRPSTSVYDGLRREPLPPIQSLSLLDLESTQDPASSESMSNFGAQPEEHPIEACLGAPALCFAARRHRLSIMSASERASTLIGSESEHDFGSDTLFDSMRTRISEMTPMRADRIFDLDRCHLDIRSPLQSSFDDIPTISHTTPTHRGIDRMRSSPNSTHTAQQHMGVASITLDDEEDGWSSDWDIPSKSADEDDHRLPGQGGLRSYGGLFTGSRMGLGLQSNGSNTSFGTAREGFSVDGSSMRETNSILDWNDGVSIHTSNSHGSGYRPKTVHAKESMLSSTRAGRRAPTYHVRSQSVPVVNTLRGRTPLPSENWDDDFLDDDDGEFGMSKSDITMVIPRAIEERQASIIGHLGCVREFALLVEDLKRLRDTAITKGIRHKVDSDLWDEADGIIALATLDDDEEDAPLKKDKLHRQNTWSPQQRRREQQNQRIMDENSAYTTASSRHSVLSPDDDIFGGNDGNLPSTPRGGRRLSPVSSISPMSRKIVDKNDPIEVAKSMMEKMQHRQRSVDSLRRGGYDGKVHFDTDMLRNLVVQTGILKQKLARSVEGYPPSPEKGLRLKIRTMEPPADDKFDFDLSPIKSSLDEDMRALDRVNPNGLEYTPVIGVA
ncbi:hypothetical protein BDD12DRAFT_426806 [Trichophaea hybrida]|nr:hypothetical protein BDD12DRAFT_426806 [Trichophaea hybrida]